VRDLSSSLVTGGAGFIGSTLVRKLLERDDVSRVIVLDSFTYAANPQNLSGPDLDPRFTLVKGDINDSELVAKTLRDHQVTAIFNLAAESHVDRSIEDPSVFVTTNVSGTSSLLDQARAAKIPMLQCSTDEVYGPTPFPEKFSESTPLAPSSPYAASKAGAELLVRAANITYGQDVITARCSNCYGPRQHREKLIPTLVYQALREQPLPIYGTGSQIRDWMHVNDCALGLISAFTNGRSGGIYNLGANSEHTNIGIARTILKLLHKPESLIKHVDDRPGHDVRYALDARRALQLIKWKARIPFRSGFDGVIRELAANLRPSEVSK